MGGYGKDAIPTMYTHIVNKKNMAKKKGICRDEECLMFNQVQEADENEFFCKECNQPLFPIGNGGNDEDSWLKKHAKQIAIGVGALAILGGGGYGISTMMSGDKAAVENTKSKLNPESSVTTVNTDSLEKVRQDSILKAKEDSIKKALEENNSGSKPDGGKTVTTPTPAPVAAPKSLNLGYATYKGRTRNGKPDDTNGVLTFRSSHVIDSNDPKGRMADAGDYVIGQFSDGHLVVGTHYGADGVVKGKIIIGK